MFSSMQSFTRRCSRAFGVRSPTGTRFLHNSVPRHFVAIPFPESVVKSIADLQNNLQTPLSTSRVKWVPHQNFHITLKFLGGILETEESLERTKEILASIAASHLPFQVELKGLGVFPKWKKPRVLFVNVSEGVGPMKNIAVRVEKELENAKIIKTGALKKEVSQRPHVTIGRWREIHVREMQGDVVREVTAPYVYPIAEFPVTQLTLFHSSLDVDAPVYTPIYTVKLKGVQQS